ncbi:hypothetical protein XA39_06050 [Acinetobacter tandoii]|uniref:AbaSI family restriction endonuclease n=1 Tax=Acinetobacter tandoii TaxID=202954 RepID=UPI000C20F4A2|nr:restriction endonuclease [Acinetobacter tandoii]PJG43764.1 hypothetical protein XA39_06050 [Acinetobacter tandoii]
MSNCYENKSILYTEYFFKQLNKTKNKIYESYVINRILTLLNDHTLKFVTQQYVRLSDTHYALTDLYFPQLGLHIEIDEGHHYDLKQANVVERGNDFKIEKKILSQSEKDRIRQSHIVNRTSHDLKRINVFKHLENGETLSLFDINNQVDRLVDYIRIVRDELVTSTKFQNWNIENEFNPNTYIEKGYLDANDEIIFLSSDDVCKCFGAKLNPYKSGGVKNPQDKGILIWFPKLYENDEWLNSISEDDQFIYEKNKNNIKNGEMYDIWKKGEKRRLVFGRVRNNLINKGTSLFKFYGLYELHDLNKESGGTWKLVSKRVELK